GWRKGGDSVARAPAAARQGEGVLVQVFAHFAQAAEEAKELAREFDAAATRRGFKTLESRGCPGARRTLHLAVPHPEVAEPVQSLCWQRRTQSKRATTAPGGLPRKSRCWGRRPTPRWRGESTAASTR